MTCPGVARFGLLTFFLAAGCDGEPAEPSNDAGAPVVATIVVTVTRTTLSAPGETTQSFAEARTAHGQAVAAVAFDWTSSNTAVASVTSSGLITALANGTTLIRASFAGITSNTVVVTVAIVPMSAQQLVFLSSPSASPLADLYLINADGSGRVRITNFPTPPVGRAREFAISSSWSPDGKRLVFEIFVDSLTHDFTALALVNADGTGQQRLAVHGLAPSWSPDGSKIAFIRRFGAGPDIFVMNPDGTGVTNLTNTFNVVEQHPAWSPDGRLIAFAAGGDSLGGMGLYVMNADGTGRKLLTNHDTIEETQPAWSPDGRQIAFIRWPGGPITNMDLWVMNADGTGMRRIMVPDAFEQSPSWSRDGRRLAFSSTRDLIVPELNGRYPQIWTVNLDGTGLLQLTSGFSSNQYPKWRP
jgi:Tol biopolymer transport system component